MERLGLSSKRFTTTVLVVSFTILLVLLMVSTTYWNSRFNLTGEVSNPKVSEKKIKHVTVLHVDSKNDSSQPSSRPDNKLLNGLLAPRFDERSCLSRYQFPLYRKASSHKPSSYLMSKLRNYELLHKRCGPYTASYTRAVKGLKKSRYMSNTKCNYVIWRPANGLGNRIISLASSFFYALLTNRVLLVDFGSDMADLFCEPFPNTTWLLPKDFPLKNKFGSSELRSDHSLERMLKKSNFNRSNKSQPLLVYLNLGHNDYDLQQLFHCDQSQALLRNVPWLILMSDQYFAPSFFFIPSFKQEVNKLFPEQETVFHHLGRYLLHPSNQAWGLIARFYQVYLAKADERVGLQIRVFKPQATPFQTVMDQILGCTLTKKLLPELDQQKSVVSPSKNWISKAILVTSLDSSYYENLSNMYWTKPTVTGEVVGVYQPSHEEYQHHGNNMHNLKAWAEINLLSLSDILVTSSWSTFGYVAQGLGGLKPWILNRPKNGRHLDQPCQQAMSMEPCYHYPPHYDCKAKTKTDFVGLFPYIKQCEDRKGGLKLVNDHEER